MKIAFAAYTDINSDARTQSILKCAQLLGQTTYISFISPEKHLDCEYYLTGKGTRSYWTFLIDTIKKLIDLKPLDIIILHDNYCAVLIPFIKYLINPKILIYDSSELYLFDFKRTYNIKAKLLQIFEFLFLKKADIVIAANDERASIMKTYFRLKNKPIIFGNFYKIEDQIDIECFEKYKKYFINKEVFTLVYAGGIGKDRMSLDITKAVATLGSGYQLLIIGAKEEKEYLKFIEYVKFNKVQNVHYLGFIPRGELRYLFQQGHVGVSAFLQNTPNNKYCASGKLYESLGESKPVLLSNNPPFDNLCKKYNVGVSGNDFKQNILLLERNYEFYTNSVKNYISNFDFYNQEKILALTLESYLDNKNRSVE